MPLPYFTAPDSADQLVKRLSAPGHGGEKTSRFLDGNLPQRFRDALPVRPVPEHLPAPTALPEPFLPRERTRRHAEAMALHPVSAAVGNVRNNAPELIELLAG